MVRKLSVERYRQKGSEHESRSIKANDSSNSQIAGLCHLALPKQGGRRGPPAIDPVEGGAKLDAFEAGSNMEAWMSTTMRNHFYSECRRKRREARRIDSTVGSAGTNPEQFAKLECSEFYNAVGNLEHSDRRALLLVGATGFSYGEVAFLCGCPIGTVKSRVSRARTALARRLDIGKRGSLFEEDAVFNAAIAGTHSAGVQM
jgi:RNA polymerase sigma-70 factor (ECF subfamily)